MLRTVRVSLLTAAASAAALTLLGACSERHFDPTTVAAEPSRRVIVMLAKDWTDAAALSAAISRAAQVPVGNVKPISSKQWSVTLGCGQPSLCDSATERLSLVHELVLSVEAEHMQTIPQRPSSASAR
jgi:hypothetical protein